MRRRKERLSRSVTDEDLDELKACVELGFGFGNGSPGSAAAPIDHRLSDAFPALDLYYAVNGLSRSSSVAAIESDGGEGSSSPNSIISPGKLLFAGDSPEMVKERLKQWAQVVACSVRQFC
ncbi:hypothetical protein QJS04_geneDACA021707 [Acorus gramineus]|uniref:Uncharacterized protein n=1 Tax=Acorus gramineus TaxID=55184 RepID=A0AAV9AHN6_ACOGR|nr:hypothetical protein QJS04_geneDACA021708 [Acorus gramineus]KAK1263738.1 hypothetical protein QJS04_geneDACA021707 [Acorus gramineus]